MKIVKDPIFISGVILVGFLIYWIFFLNHVEVNEIGVAYDRWSGDIWTQERPGWYTTGPLVKVISFSTLPMKVTLPSDAKVITTKIVRFKKEGVQEFITLQGYSYLNSSKLENVLMGYAFSGRDFPFLEVVQEPGPEHTPGALPSNKR